VTTQDEARRFFDAIAGRYDRAYAPSRDESRARLARLLAELAPRSRVLDLGVGTGRELSALQDAEHDVAGLDLSKEMLARCAKRTRPVRLVEADLWAPLPFDADAFDAVVALHGTLAHPPDATALGPFAREASRVLAPSGVFVAEVRLPDWPASPDEPGERRTLRVDTSRAVVTDLVTGAAIEALAFPAAVWRETFGPFLAVEKAVETGTELFLVARKAR
jgi:SAM-dependent methyltransferase